MLCTFREQPGFIRYGLADIGDLAFFEGTPSKV